ncbi:MAG: hypothetical protein ACHQ9S_00860 [Candidatus Binatia bacterium]
MPDCQKACCGIGRFRAAPTATRRRGKAPSRDRPGAEWRAIFRDDGDRERFVERLARLVGEEAVVLCAYVLLDNHLGIARASVAAHLRAIDAETI